MQLKLLKNDTIPWIQIWSLDHGFNGIGNGLDSSNIVNQIFKSTLNKIKFKAQSKGIVPRICE